MISLAYSGPIQHVIVVMLGRNSYDDVLGSLYDASNEAPFARAPRGQASLDGADVRGLRPASIPITAYLARQFMVCDRWFASTPARGAANLLFAHCAAADGTLERNVLSALDAVRGVRRLDPNWKIYFHDDSLVARALPYAERCWDDAANDNLANYDEIDYPPGRANVLASPTTTFLQDVAQNRLPAYAFVEARRGLRRAPVSVATGSSVYGEDADPFDDEALLREVYVALRTSPYWERALMLVAYADSSPNGDHVAPPPGWGGRVPAIVVSPFVEPGSRLRNAAPFEHASIVKTLWQCFGLHRSGATSINARDAAAPSLLDHLAREVVNRPPHAAEMGGFEELAAR